MTKVGSHTVGWGAVLSMAFIAVSQVGCASAVDGQWSDPQLSEGALRGKRVMVTCEAEEAVVKRLCVDQMVAAVSARGATAVMPPQALLAASGKPSANPPDQPYLAAAQAQGAGAVITSHMAPSSTSRGSGFSVGLGGFGFGGGGIATGVGISAPIGGGELNTQYAANTRVLDLNGKLLWTAKASSSARTSDLQSQVNELTRTTFEALDKSRLF